MGKLSRGHYFPAEAEVTGHAQKNEDEDECNNVVAKLVVPHVDVDEKFFRVFVMAVNFKAVQSWSVQAVKRFDVTFYSVSQVT